MNSILIEPKNSTFISNVEKEKNFSSLDYLSISNCISDNSNIKCLSLLNFDIDIIKNASILLHTAELIVPIEILKQSKTKYEKNISILNNTESFCENSVTWNTKPSTSLFSKTPIRNCNSSTKYLTIDVTELICDYLYNNLPNNGITIECCDPDLLMILPKYKIMYSIKLFVKYSIKNNESTCPALYLQHKCPCTQLLKSKEAIHFNKITEDASLNISYDKECSIITICKKGLYNCYWQSYIEGSNSESEVRVSLKNLTKDEIINSQSSLVMPGLFSGYALINVSEEGEQFALINDSEGEIELSRDQASILIYNL
ncbi:hypothetical protein SAMN04487886_11358 [Clostridium sp. DSM 8431]|uniref:DNRLRE domain-containing protein n=1 Tax=Clostridium sp. DSM 8431 TaxID=1761781 RepID=UPI0008F1B916|nr:DNRLRE domain-containing protein [Clostridium sp. DSM 8431]SFU75306.1 hypothetical protein SAMN04487886_11358 [Clostridium sp. DSM 8431]